MSMQDTLGREQVSTQGTFARQHVITQDTLAREHIFSMYGTQFNININKVSPGVSFCRDESVANRHVSAAT